MGHTPDVHKSSYTLPDDIYQTVKISKLLMLMEKGTAGEHQGKTLDDIPIDLEQNLLNDYVPTDDENDDRNETTNNETEDYVVSRAQSILKKSVQNERVMTSHAKRTKRILIPWTEDKKKCFNLFYTTH